MSLPARAPLGPFSAFDDHSLRARFAPPLSDRTTGNVHRPTRCPRCCDTASTLTWLSPTATHAECPVCASLIAITITRQPAATRVPPPYCALACTAPAQPPSAGPGPSSWHPPPLCVMPLAAALASEPLPCAPGVHPFALPASARLALAVSDFRDCSVRSHPADPSLACLFRASLVVAVVPARQYAYLRQCLLHSWYERAPSMRATESDIAAYAVALALHAPLPQPPTGPFLGQAPALLPFHHNPDPGVYRPALCAAPGLDGTDADPSASLYTPVAAPRLPLRPAALAALLVPIGHPYADYLVNAAAFGFHLLATPPPVSRRNPRSAQDARALVDPAYCRAIADDLARGALVDVTHWKQRRPRPPTIQAPLYPKPKEGGKVRLISDMSAGLRSVNSYVRPGALPKVRLATLRTVCLRVLYLRSRHPGVPVVLGRVDISAAYRNLPVSVYDRWQNAHAVGPSVYLNCALPFGHSASCANMTTLTTAIADHLAARSIWSSFYVDDCLFACLEPEASHYVALIKDAIAAFCLPVNFSKLEKDGPPATARELLGVWIDAAACTVSVTPPRLAKLTAAIDGLLARPRATPAVLRRLAGLLTFVTPALPFARLFTDSIYAAAYSGTSSTQLTPAVLRDLTSWRSLLAHWNGTSAFRLAADVTPAVVASTDACRAGWGWFAHGINQYGCGPFHADERAVYSTALAELVAIGACLYHLAPRYPGATITIHTDSSACSHLLRRLRTTDPRLHVLLSHLACLQLRFAVTLDVQWRAGALNTTADFLSRHNRLPPALASSSPPPQRCPAPQRSRHQWATTALTLARGTRPPSSLPLPPSRDPSLTALPQRFVTGTATATPSCVTPTCLYRWTP